MGNDRDLHDQLASVLGNMTHLVKADGTKIPFEDEPKGSVEPPVVETPAPPVSQSVSSSPMTEKERLQEWFKAATPVGYTKNVRVLDPDPNVTAYGHRVDTCMLDHEPLDWNVIWLPEGYFNGGSEKTFRRGFSGHHQYLHERSQKNRFINGRPKTLYYGGPTYQRPPDFWELLNFPNSVRATSFPHGVVDETTEGQIRDRNHAVRCAEWIESNGIEMVKPTQTPCTSPGFMVDYDLLEISQTAIDRHVRSRSKRGKPAYETQGLYEQYVYNHLMDVGDTIPEEKLPEFTDADDSKHVEAVANTTVLTSKEVDDLPWPAANDDPTTESGQSSHEPAHKAPTKGVLRHSRLHVHLNRLTARDDVAKAMRAAYQRGQPCLDRPYSEVAVYLAKQGIEVPPRKPECFHVTKKSHSLLSRQRAMLLDSVNWFFVNVWEANPSYADEEINKLLNQVGEIEDRMEELGVALFWLRSIHGFFYEGESRFEYAEDWMPDYPDWVGSLRADTAKSVRKVNLTPVSNVPPDTPDQIQIRSWIRQKYGPVKWQKRYRAIANGRVTLGHTFKSAFRRQSDIADELRRYNDWLEKSECLNGVTPGFKGVSSVVTNVRKYERTVGTEEGARNHIALMRREELSRPLPLSTSVVRGDLNKEIGYTARMLLNRGVSQEALMKQHDLLSNNPVYLIGEGLVEPDVVEWASVDQLRSMRPIPYQKETFVFRKPPSLVRKKDHVDAARESARSLGDRIRQPFRRLFKAFVPYTTVDFVKESGAS